jgi:amino acid adenylation domain-containing protein
MSLHQLLAESARRWPDRPAVVEAGGAATTYGELEARVRRLAVALAGRGVGRGDRVAVWAEKSAGAVATMQAALRLGAAYVPLDPLAPPARARKILCDAAPRVLAASRGCAAAAAAAGWSTGAGLLEIEDEGAAPGPRAAGGAGLARAASGAGLARAASGAGLARAASGAGLAALASGPPEAGVAVEPGELAYILYTSGSTGEPKGVAISHLGARSFVDWAVALLAPGPEDRFANHAPLAFDLSVLDLYAAFASGAAVCLIPDGTWSPARLVEIVRREQLTLWYSVPSALVLMMEHGGLLALDRLPLRAILFAGEPFPPAQLRRLMRRWPAPRYLNLYGPTETNVCTCCELAAPPAEGAAAVPIGRACCGDRVWAVRPDGEPAGPGEEGELMVAGPTVMRGYWGRPELAGRPYATGDLVRLEADGNYVFVGRRDQCVKLRGRRIELGEIESVLAAHPAVAEAAAVVAGEGLAARLAAFVVPRGSGAPVDLLDIKRHCALHLPPYMIVEELRQLAALPRSRNGKLDRGRLAATAAGGDRLAARAAAGE